MPAVTRALGNRINQSTCHTYGQISIRKGYDIGHTKTPRLQELTLGRRSGNYWQEESLGCQEELSMGYFLEGWLGEINTPLSVSFSA